ncbi:MAG: copper resistance protein CopC [Acidimicrobiia bacterium]|nr:copper resistance protein CopC [Acidimicrobiia bacterium]
MALVLTAALGLWMAPVGAHTALLQASPGPDQTAGGTIDFVDLAFLDPVSDAIVTLSFNGEPIAGVTTVSDGEIVRFELDDPLQLPGRYQVFYEMTSYDADYTTSGYFFTYAADAPQPARIALPGDESGDTSLLPIVATAVGLASLVGLLAAFVWRLDAKRRQQIQADTGSASDW